MSHEPATPMTDGDRLLYVYGIVRRGFDPTRAPAGMDEEPVFVLEDGQLAALASRVPVALYAPEIIENKSGDVQWLSPRAMAHDRVLTWAQEHGGVIPLPMFSMWGSDAALADSLRERTPDLTRSFDRVQDADEFGLRAHRQDAVMLAAIPDIDPEMAASHREAAAAPPGQRYLLERKLADRGKAAVRAASQRMARDLFETLRPLAREALTRPLVPPAGAVAEATLVLNAAFLVDRARLDAFRAAVASQIAALQPRGLVFDFTGPWPPYNFVK